MDALLRIPFQFDPLALQKRAHIRSNSEDAEQFARLLEKASIIAQPKALYTEAFVEERGADWVRIDNVVFTSQTMRWNLEQVERVFPYVATCGHEVDAIQLPAEDFLQRYWLDMIKTSLLESASQYLHNHLQQHDQIYHLAAMHPGSADVGVWAIEEQRLLFDLLGGVTPLIGVTLTESCLMVPNKTVSGIFFSTQIDFRSCQVCQREHCPSRAAPFDRALWQQIRAGGNLP